MAARFGAYWLAAAVAGIIFFPAEASGVGTYDDYGRFSFFLRAPAQASLEGRVTRAEGPGHYGTIFSLSAHFPVKERVLLLAEAPYVSIVSKEFEEHSLGDARFRLRARLFTVWGVTVLIYGTLCTGSGEVNLFPYSSGSVDYGGGLAVRDTVAGVVLWGAVDGTKVTRLDESLKQDELHGDFTTISAGIALPVGGRHGLLAGGAWPIYASGARRQVYFAQADVAYAQSLWFSLIAQAEAGTNSERATDFALGIGMRVSY